MILDRIQFLIRTTESLFRLTTGKTLTQSSATIVNAFLSTSTKLVLFKALAMISQMIAGKILGAGPFGTLTLILAIGNFWCLPFFVCWALSYVNHVSEDDDEHAAPEYLNSALAMIGVSVGICTPLLFVFRSWIAELLRIDPSIWTMGCLFGTIMGGYYFCKSIFQAKQDWASFSTCEFLFASTLAAGTLILSLRQTSGNLQGMIAVYALANLAGASPAFRSIVRSLQLPKPDSILKTLRQGFGILLSFVFSLCAMQLDKFFLNYYCDFERVGHYQAYYFSTYGIFSGFTVILSNYLLPIYGKYNKYTLKTMLTRFLLFCTLPTFACSLLIGWGAFWIYGKSFHFDWLNLLWASAFNTSMFWLQVMIVFSMSLGQKALICNSLVYIVFMIVQLAVMPQLIHASGVLGAFQGMTAASAASVLALLMALPLLVKQNTSRI